MTAQRNTVQREAEVGERPDHGGSDAERAAAPAAYAAARRSVENPARLAAVRATGLLDSEAEAVFDRLTRLAVRLVGAPAAFLSLVDEHRDFYKSVCGVGEPLASARELAGPTFCHYAVQSPEPLVIPDTAADPAYRDVPTVRSLGVAAYVGIPLLVGGQVVGSFCAVDTRPRRWTPEDLEVLTELAASAQRELELRAALRAAERAAEDLRAQAVELELANQQLQDQAAELEARTAEAVDAGRAAEAARARAAGLLARMADAHALLDAEFRVVDVNPAMERGVGMARAELQGRTIWELFPGLVGTDAERFHRQVVETGVEAHAIFPYADGRLDVVAEVDAYPTDAGGVAVFWRDVSARVRAVRALRDSEEKYRSLFERMDQGVCLVEVLVDADGRPEDYRFLEVNPAFAAQTGLADAAGRTARELVPGLEPHWAEVYGRVARTGEPVRFQQGSDVMGRWFDVFAFGVGDPAARRVAILFTDVSAARRAELERERLVAALQLERARLAEVFRRAPAFLAVMRGPRHVFEFVNDAYTRLVAFRDVVGKPVWDALPEVRGQGFETLLDGVYRSGEPFVGREIPITVAATPGAPPEERFLDFVYQPLVEADGARSGVIAHGVDVTDQVRARRDVERLLAEAEAARRAAEGARAEAELGREAAEAGARAKAEFLATMSHEIRTPINAIVGYTQLLELGIPDPVTPAQRDQLARVTASARHLLGLVNDVLDVAKLDAGEVRVAREDASTGPAAAAALALVRPQADQRGVRLVGECPDVAYVGDEARVRQVLVNLLSNAVKFTADGGTVAVTCGAQAEAPPAAQLTGAGPWAFVAVADTGVGIAPDRQAAVFDPFVQAPAGQTAYTRTQGGTGLGLTISRRLARLMGGDLTLESAPGAGSTFTLWLPAAAAAPAGEGETAAARGERAGLAGSGWRVHGLAEIGRALREETDAILEAYTAALRADPAAPRAKAMPQAQLEDHAITLLADLAQSLVILDGAGDEAGALMGDGTAIQRTVAEVHGARRAAQGWTEAALRRDHGVLGETVERAVRARVAARAGDVSEGLRVLAELQARTEALSVAAYRRACDAAEGDRPGAPPDA